MGSKAKILLQIILLSICLFAQSDVDGPLYIVGSDPKLYVPKTPSAASVPDSFLVKLPDNSIGTYPLSFTRTMISGFWAGPFWDSIPDKPSSFTPKLHHHDSLYYRKSEVTTIVNGKEPAISTSTSDKFWNGLKQWVNITIGNVLGLNDTITNHRTAIASKLNISDTSSLARKNHGHSQSQITGLVDTVTAHRNAINNKQPLDTDLTTIAGLTHSNRHVMVSNGSSWTRRALAEDDLPSLSISKITNLQDNLDGKEPAITGTENKVLSIKSGGSGVKAGSIYDNGNVVHFEKAFIGNSLSTGIRHYHDLYLYSNQNATETGILKIVMPQAWTNTFQRITIKGYNYKGGQGAWECIIGGYNYNAAIDANDAWANYSAEIRGSAPFSTVKLGYDGSKCVILLGNDGTDWRYAKVAISDMLVGGAIYNWETGWSASIITSETGITKIVAPTVNSGVSADWNALINRPSYFAPSAHSHAWPDITSKPSTFAPSSHGLVSSAHTVSGLTAGHVLKALSATTYGFAAITPANIGAPAIGTERSLSVTTAGWVTIATCATGRAYGEFHVYDYTSSKHNFAKITASTSYGKNNVSVIGGNRYSPARSIAHARVLYNSSDRTYGGAKLQVYCESPTFTLYVKQFLSQEFTGWKAWNNITPVAEGTPTGWSQDDSTYLQDITNPNHSFVGNVFSGKGLLLSGGSESTITMEEANVTTISMKPYQYGGLTIGSTNSGHSIMRNSTAQTLLINRLYGETTYPIVGFSVANSGSYFFGPIVGSSPAGHYFYNDSDSKTTLICGGSSYEASNGPSIVMRGNTFSYAPEQGCIKLMPGATANAHISLEGNRVVMSRRNVGTAATINITTNPQIIDLNSYAGISRFDITTSMTDAPVVYFQNATEGDEIFVKIVEAGQYASEYGIGLGWNIDPHDGTWMKYATKRYFHLICEGTATASGVTANKWWIAGVHGLYSP